MIYLCIKLLHILSATVLFGTGLGTAFYKWHSDHHGDLAGIHRANQTVVLADWVFTTPAIVVQPLTGLYLLHIAGIPASTPWVFWAFVLYGIAGACWLPVVWLQLKMRDQAHEAYLSRMHLPERYFSYARIWFWLGVPAFIAMVLTFALMVIKPAQLF